MTRRDEELLAAGVVRRRARRLLDVIDTDRDLSDPYGEHRRAWIDEVKDAAEELDLALDASSALLVGNREPLEALEVLEAAISQ